MKPMPFAIIKARLRSFAPSLLALSVVLGLALRPHAQQPPAANAERASHVPPARLAHLAKGVNLSNWFWLFPGTWDAAYTTARCGEPAFFSADDAATLARLGLTHVRLPLDTNAFITLEKPGELNPSTLKRLDDAIAMLLAHKLAVVIDMHPLGATRPTDFAKGMEIPGPIADAYVTMWGALAGHLATTDPEMVFLEPCNEPVFEGQAAAWAALQDRLVAAIRAQCPAHTILATSVRWSNLDELLKTKPLADDNIVYNFHFYEPMTFTHQAATWGAPNWKHLKNVPYPGTPERAGPVVPTIADEKARGELEWYAKQGWNASKIDGLIAAADAWGVRHHVPVTCNEFGAFRQASDPVDRAAWIHDVRASLERHHIGWCMWEWTSGFGLVTGDAGKRVVDAETARALGLP